MGRRLAGELLLDAITGQRSGCDLPHACEAGGGGAGGRWRSGRRGGGRGRREGQRRRAGAQAGEEIDVAHGATAETDEGGNGDQREQKSAWHGRNAEAAGWWSAG